MNDPTHTAAGGHCVFWLETPVSCVTWRLFHVLWKWAWCCSLFVWRIILPILFELNLQKYIQFWTWINTNRHLPNNDLTATTTTTTTRPLLLSPFHPVCAALMLVWNAVWIFSSQFVSCNCGRYCWKEVYSLNKSDVQCWWTEITPLLLPISLLCLQSTNPVSVCFFSVPSSAESRPDEPPQVPHVTAVLLAGLPAAVGRSGAAGRRGVSPPAPGSAPPGKAGARSRRRQQDQEGPPEPHRVHRAAAHGPGEALREAEVSVYAW